MSARKRYRPYGVNRFAHAVAMAGAALLSKDDVLQRASYVHECCTAIITGKASKTEWRHLADCVNVVEELCRMRLVDGQTTLEATQDVIVGILDRKRDTGSVALYAIEVGVLQAFAADYSAVLSGITQSEYMQAQTRVEDRIRRVLSGERIPASTRVVVAA
jgi:hypothetical protein